MRFQLEMKSTLTIRVGVKIRKQKAFYGLQFNIYSVQEIIIERECCLSDKVHDHQVQDDVGKDEISESPFRCNAEELVLVLGVRLEAQADWKGIGKLAR